MWGLLSLTYCYSLRSKWQGKWRFTMWHSGTVSYIVLLLVTGFWLLERPSFFLRDHDVSKTKNQQLTTEPARHSDRCGAAIWPGISEWASRSEWRNLSWWRQRTDFWSATAQARWHVVKREFSALPHKVSLTEDGSRHGTQRLSGVYLTPNTQYPTPAIHQFGSPPAQPL